jgi:hypothetical protein
MSQPAPHPHHVSQLYGPALGGIVHALADRGEQTAAEYQARADDAWTLVQSFQPRDTIDLMLTGQFITMNELFADASRDILRGMSDSLKQRARSSAVAMGRLALAQVGELERRGIQPYRTDPVAEQRPVQTAETQTTEASADEPVKQPQPNAAAAPAQLSAAAPQPAPSEPAPPAEETSWVDEPYQEYLEETPAMLAAAMVAAKDLPPPLPPEADLSASAPSEYGPARKHTKHPYAEAMAAAAD